MTKTNTKENTRISENENVEEVLKVSTNIANNQIAAFLLQPLGGYMSV